MITKNNVLLEGLVVHKFVTDQVAILTINTGSATPKNNYPKILFFGDIIKNIEKNIEVQDNVRIDGNIQSSKHKPNIPNQKTVSIFGENITKLAPTSTENPSPYFTNKIEISGKIFNIDKVYDNLIKFKILTNKNNHISFVPLFYYTDTPDDVLKEFKKEDIVDITGCVQTIKKESHGKFHFFENYVITDIHHKE